ncbi:DUF421 domain-containing protein [Desulfolucanica intricata]|uniref:DUF421 domain-containing protein n=1 Tax=Desulfolucanica intricata TaxID=1285191 RepID=UPI00082F59CC|nr:DUF421 domain-containing protein [Desulfolucanica intricata]
MDVTAYIYRTVLIYFFLLVVIRLMGKREVGQLCPFDFVVAIIIAELAAIPLVSKEIPLLHGVVPLLTLGVLEVILSLVTFHSPVLRKIINGHPQVIIENGNLCQEEMKKARYSLDDLLSHLRDKGIINISDVEFAMLETCGKLSVIPKSQKRPVTPEDLHLETNYEGLPTVLVMDGAVQGENLKQIQLDENWLMDRLKEAGLNPRKVFLATLGSDGQLDIVKDQEEKEGK